MFTEETYNFFAYSKALEDKTRIEDLVDYFWNLYIEEGLSKVLLVLKVIGVVVNRPKISKKLIEELNSKFLKVCSKEDLQKWNEFKELAINILEIIANFIHQRDNFFDKNKTKNTMNGELLVIAAEKIMSELAVPFNPNVEIKGVDTFEHRMDTYDAFVGFVSHIIKYFIGEGIDFKQTSKIYSEDDIFVASNHFMLNAHWDELMDIKEYFCFSRISIKKDKGKYKVIFLDEDFDKSVLISNFREKNYMGNLHEELLLRADNLSSEMNNNKKKLILSLEN